jgi:hypothetical protein
MSVVGTYLTVFNMIIWKKNRKVEGRRWRGGRVGRRMTEKKIWFVL